MALSHSIRAVVLVIATASATAAQQAPTPAPAAADFKLFLGGSQVGTEQVAVVRGSGGWTIISSGRSGAPLNIVTRNLEIRYDADWKPLELTLDATARGLAVALHITVAGTAATTQGTSAGQQINSTDTIDPTALLLPSPFFAAYEAVAARLKTAGPGSVIAVYQGRPMPLTIQVGDSQTEQIQTVARLVRATRTHATLAAAGVAEVDADIWADEAGRLLRVSIPSQALEFVRDDISSVGSRRVVISRDGDEQIRIAANGFNLAGTISKPAGAAGKRLPAIVLVAGSGPVDRDEMVAGIPVLGQLAGALADAGFLVLRYDKRGIGQSGGRAESAGHTEYAEDLRAAVKFLADRKDADPKRIAIVGHSEGGSLALLVADKDRRVAAIALMAAPGMIGADLILAQQKHLLDRLNLPEADKQAKVELQKRIQEAAITGKGLDALPADVRRQIDNAEFQSILSHDPAKVMPSVRQPILIVQGALDTQVDPSNADRLAALARARKRAAPVDVVTIPGVNHLFVPATTGEVDEYWTLKEKQITPALSSAIVAWLRKTLPAPSR